MGLEIGRTDAVITDVTVGLIFPKMDMSKTRVIRVTDRKEGLK